jgi:hypothetical protein
VSEQLLDDPQIGATTEQLGGKGMPKRMSMRTTAKTSYAGQSLDGVVDGPRCDWPFPERVPGGRGLKQERSCVRPWPVFLAEIASQQGAVLHRRQWRTALALPANPLLQGHNAQTGPPTHRDHVCDCQALDLAAAQPQAQSDKKSACANVAAPTKVERTTHAANLSGGERLGRAKRHDQPPTGVGL